MIIIISSVRDLDVKESYILKLECKVFVVLFFARDEFTVSIFLLTLNDF